MVGLFFWIHFFFSNLTSHTAAVLPIVLAVGAGIPGIPLVPLALLCVYSLGLMGVISPYATGPAPIYFASGFINRRDFWKLASFSECCSSRRCSPSAFRGFCCERRLQSQSMDGLEPHGCLTARLAALLAGGKLRVFSRCGSFVALRGHKVYAAASAGPSFASSEAMAGVRTGARRIVELARKQFGVVTRADLATTEVSWKWLRGRLATGEWSRMHRGVFRLGCRQPTLEEREMAALMAAGRGAVLSHLTAARRLGLEVPKCESVQLTIPESRRASVKGAKVSRSRSLSVSDVTTRRGFRMTNLARTMIDLASVLDNGELRAAFDSAVRQDKANVGWISRSLYRHGSGRRGVGRLRALIDECRQGDEVPDSALESLGQELAKATGHKPQLHWDVVDGARHVAEVDLAWPELRLCVEFDGWKTHGTRAAFVRDRARDRELFPLGWTVLRYTWDDVVHNPDAVIDQLIRSLESRAGAFPPAPSRRNRRR